MVYVEWKGHSIPIKRDDSKNRHELKLELTDNEYEKLAKGAIAYKIDSVALLLERTIKDLLQDCDI